MNKNLIQKFLDRACYDEQDQRELEDWCNVEKFAELIVRECIDVAKEAQRNHDDADFWIEQHFGVDK